ncbi:MAG: M28 family peptidase [Bacteroidia bacterium]|nr:M28 family peptidase [Bacteroidia bacterium]
MLSLRILITICFTAICLICSAQSNVFITDQKADAVIKGNYDPTVYSASIIMDDHEFILCNLIDGLISTDTLESYLVKLERFHTRHTYSDTLSADTGIGATRRWVHKKFKQFSGRNENRLIPAYLQFDQIGGGSCGNGFGWRNIIAVLPGSDTSDQSNVIIEAHIDSRCEVNCDVNCFAPGVDDNGSGSALVIELARVMSRFTFKHNIIFMLTIGEEQGLLGAAAMSKYFVDNAIPLKAVLNNDVVGGIICGATSSPPSCPFEGHIDSTQLRIFSNGNPAEPFRGLARTVKMFYEEKLLDEVNVPMTLSVMLQEDRTGRGGDHIPFRLDGFRNIRFTSANEHGDAGVGVGYTDRQHTSGDILGVDTNGDMSLDEYYVDMNYLARNAVVNGMSATLLASGPETPGFKLLDEPQGLRVEITSGFLPEYRIGVRETGTTSDFVAVYRTEDSLFRIPQLTGGQSYYISVAGIDDEGIMSPFTSEILGSNDANTGPGPVDDLPYKLNCSLIGIDEPKEEKALVDIWVVPNPAEGKIRIIMDVSFEVKGEYHLIVSDNTGREIDVIPLQLRNGMNSINYSNDLSAGVYFVSLMRDGVVVRSEKASIF